MKRIFSLLLIGCILALSMAPSVSAATVSDTGGMFEVLDLCMPNGGTSRKVYAEPGVNGVYASFNITEAGTIRYFDILFTVSSGRSPTSAYISTSTSGAIVSVDLNLVQVSDSIWRAYGSGEYTPRSFVVFITGVSPVEFNSVRISYSAMEGYDENAQCSISSAGGYNATINYIPTDIINYRSWSATSNPESKWLHLLISCANWRKYDYIDFQVNLLCSGITSVYATLGDGFVPLTVSYLDNSSLNSSYTVLCRLDLRNVDRTSSEGLYIHVEADENVGSTNFVSMEGCRGWLTYQTANPFFTWLRTIDSRLYTGFKNINNALTNIYEALSGNVTTGNQFKEESSDLISGLGDITASMDSVERPSLDSINLDFSSDISGASTLMGNIFTTFTSVDWMSRLFLVSITLVLVSYVLYGKD